MDDLVTQAKQQAVLETERCCYKRVYPDQTLYGRLAKEIERLRDALRTVTSMTESGSDPRDIILMGRLASGDLQAKFSAAEIAVISSALGVDARGVAHRNYVVAPVASERSTDNDKIALLEKMANAGWLRRSQPGMGVYQVTEAGAAAIGYRLPR